MKEYSFDYKKLLIIPKKCKIKMKLPIHLKTKQIKLECKHYKKDDFINLSPYFILGAYENRGHIIDEKYMNNQRLWKISFDFLYRIVYSE